MGDKNSNDNHLSHSDIAELNNYQERKNVHFSVESSNTKPFDISLMTGNNQSNNSKEGEK